MKDEVSTLTEEAQYTSLRESNHQLVHQLIEETQPLFDPSEHNTVMFNLELLIGKSFKDIFFVDYPEDALDGHRVIGRTAAMQLCLSNEQKAIMTFTYNVLGIDGFGFEDTITHTLDSSYLTSWIEKVPTALIKNPSYQERDIIRDGRFITHDTTEKNKHLAHYQKQLQSMLKANERGDVFIFGNSSGNNALSPGDLQPEKR